MAGIMVVKEGGEKEPFSEGKVRNALRRAGISGNEATEILRSLETRLYDGITTKRIYSLVYELVDEMRPEVSHRYNLKRALLEIGPEGYEFEDFIGRLMGLQGYRTELRQTLEGKCVSHEIDVVATKGGLTYPMECKFHNQPGIKCRIQTALYVYARFLDLKEGAARGTCRPLAKPWLVTNTKFSEDVIRYAECMEMPLLGWRYPLKKGLEALIDRTKCYPVTVIPMGNDILRRLLKSKIVTIADIPESPQSLSDRASIPLGKAREIVQRAEYAR
ncbi:MAG: ATP cone domain-containing protein [Candidatus Micrarchaeia archaeon]